jgi:tripartite ATP-independent transporter DctP family solute receptor
VVLVPQGVILRTKEGLLMKKWLIVFMVPLFGLGIAITGSHSKEPQGKTPGSRHYVLRLGIEHGPDHPYTQVMKRYSKLVSQKTKGDVEIKLYPSAQLGSAPEMIEGLQIGSIDLVYTAPAYFRSQIPEMDVLVIPFLIESAEHYERLMAGKVGKFIAAGLEKNGFIVLAYYYGGMREFTNNRKPINTLGDMKGLKMRVPGLPVIIKCFEKFGVLPTPVPFSDLYTALQTGMVDAQENPVAQIYDSKFYEVQKYLSLSDHMLTPVGLIISKRSLEKLPAECQKALKKAAEEVVPWNRDNFRKVEKETLARLKEKGMQVNEIRDKEGFKKAVESLYVEIPKMIGNKDVGWILDEAKKCR